MQINLRNDTVLVRLKNSYEYDRLLERAAKSDLILVDDPGDMSGKLLIGEVLDIGPGRKMSGVYKTEDITIGQTVIFQVSDQISYKKDGEIYFLIGMGNLLATT